MRDITSHQINECNSAIRIIADEPDATNGGASHEYVCQIQTRGSVEETKILFQRGPIKEVGTNGLTHEVLLAILIDRMQGFQKGPYSCRENSIALTKLEEAKHWLEARTKARVARGVEGTHEV